MEKKAIEKRMRIFLYIVVALFLVLGARLAYMQLLQNDKYSTLARENRMRFIKISAPRGELFDRNLVKLVGNQPVYTVYLDSVALKNLSKTQIEAMEERLAAILGITPQEILDKIKSQERYYEPVRIATRVSPEIVVQIEELRLEMPGVIIDIEPLREYPQGSLLAHVIGYVRQIDEEQLKRNENKGYSPGDNYGQSGLENSMEQYLRGQDGGRQVEVDSAGRPVRDLGIKKPVQGNNLILTVDHRIQQAAEEALALASERAVRDGYREARAAAAVVLDVRTGAILAMASYPSYEPDALSGFLSLEDYDEIFNSPWKPLLNRALWSYAPGSTYKMITAIAGLESNSITATENVYCPGYFFWERRFDDWRAGGHGNVNLVKAIKVSCDPYFYRLGLKAGIDNIDKYAREFGLGTGTGVELPGEDIGVNPSPDAKLRLRKPYLSEENLKAAEEIEQRYQELLDRATDPELRKELTAKRSAELIKVEWELGWHDYDTIISAIGQGDTRYNVLELANYVAAIANGGTVYQPYFVQRIEDPTGKLIRERTPVVLNQAAVSPKTLEVVREGMFQATQPPDGTATYFTNLPQVAAKTGTAEVTGRDNHALVVGYAPYNEPEIAVAVVVEFAGRGGATAGPVVNSIFQAYFDLQAE